MWKKATTNQLRADANAGARSTGKREKKQHVQSIYYSTFCWSFQDSAIVPWIDNWQLSSAWELLAHLAFYSMWQKILACRSISPVNDSSIFGEKSFQFAEKKHRQSLVRQVWRVSLDGRSEPYRKYYIWPPAGCRTVFRVVNDINCGHVPRHKLLSNIKRGSAFSFRVLNVEI